jgi:hypothetical protein
MSGLALAALAAALVGGALALWFRWIRAVALEGRRWIAYAMIAAGMAAAVVAFAAGPGALGGVLAGTAVAAGTSWIVLGALAGQSRQTPAIAVGEPLPDVVAPDAEGAPFRLADLHGQPVLIKLFRGHW